MLVLADLESGVSYSLAGDTLLGRASGEGLMALGDVRVSRHHALVWWSARASGWRVQDVGSTSGTYVAGRHLGPVDCPLAVGAELRVGCPMRVARADAPLGANVVRACVASDPWGSIPLDGMELRLNSSGQAELRLCERGTAAELPVYGAALRYLLDAELSGEDIQSPGVRLMGLRIHARSFWLAHDDAWPGVYLEPRCSVGAVLVGAIAARLRAGL